MLVRLHSQATTTPKIRAAIQACEDPAWMLSERYRISEQSVLKWRHRDSVEDLSHTPHRLQTTLSPAQESVAVALRKTLLVPLDDLLAVVREFLNPNVSRSGLDRCLRRHGVGNLRDLKVKEAKPKHSAFKAYEPGYLHIYVKYLPQMVNETSRCYLFVAIDRATRWVFIGIHNNKTAANAMHTQRATSQAVCTRGGAYVLALKGNQATLFQDAKLYLDDPDAIDNCKLFQSVDADHGRIETRTALVSTEIGWLQERHDWPGLSAIGEVTATRETGGKQTSHSRYFLLSLPLEPARFLEITRSHWHIENSLHWVLDVTMNEDQARNRTGNGAENLALLRRMALNLARTESTKGSMRGKIKKAGWSDDFMLDMIRAVIQR
jgi:predicted transposase YbfD/YdcC